MNTLKKIGILFPLIAICISCSNEKSIQAYYVDKSEDTDFISLDLPTSLFTANADLTAEEKKTLSNLKKLNLLAFQINDNNRLSYEKELITVQQILSDKKYSSLISYSQGNQKIEFFAQENKEAIKEYIVFAFDPKLGFMVARVLGNNLNPNHMYKMMKLSDKLEMSALEDFAKQIDLPNNL